MQSNSYFREAQWFNSGYIPKFDEYLDNALVSVGAPFALGLSYPMIQQHISKEEIDLIPEDLNLLRWASIIFRLYDDLATSKVWLPGLKVFLYQYKFYDRCPFLLELLILKTREILKIKKLGYMTKYTSDWGLFINPINLGGYL